MAVLPILRWPDKRLTTVCSAIIADVAALAADMLDTMYAAQGRGLASPQIGSLTRLFVMDATWKAGTPAPQVFVNPEILWRSAETAVGPEGCLSLPEITLDISRATSVKLRWQDVQMAVHEQTFTGFAAICIQHEYDHLNGVLTLDHLDPAARTTAEKALL